MGYTFARGSTITSTSVVRPEFTALRIACDYKTGNRMKSQYDADTDRQLAMYARWVKERYGKDKKVKLVWHMLKFDKDVESTRSNFELDILMDKVLREIHEMEMNKDWSPNPSRLCDWCVYRHKCPLHEKEYQDQQS